MKIILNICGIHTWDRLACLCGGSRAAVLMPK